MATTITRTPWIDDDGTGTTGTVINNAEKTLLYNQIDAAFAEMAAGMAPVEWTPTDASSENLTFTLAIGFYVVTGKVVKIWAHVTYPPTGGSAAAAIRLPFVSRSIHPFQGFYQTYGTECLFHMGPASNYVNVLNASSAIRPNSDLSGAQLIFQGDYLID